MKKLLAKRLAQCLTSSLPSGVHLKALETYHLVFGRIGNAKLAKDLPLYAAGLFPVFSYCATALKPTLLTLYENHFLPLGPALAPVVDGFVLAVLPGLEDESSEFYARSFQLLTSICAAIGDVGVFSRGLWRALLLAPEMRLSATHYLRMKLAEGDEQLRDGMVQDMPLVSHAIAAALSDKNALVQRGVLDLLLGELALHSPFFTVKAKEYNSAAVALVGGVFGALLRRDISLTKRVHSWLLGGKDGEDATAYCQKFSHDFILAAIDNEIQAVTSNTERVTAQKLTRPYKVVSALLDREEILDCVGNKLAVRILTIGQETLKPEYEDFVREVRHAFSEVVQQLGTATILSQLEKQLLKDETAAAADFQLYIFALSVLPMNDETVKKRQLPALLKATVHSLESGKVQSGGMDKAVFLCGRTLSMISLHHKRSRIPPELVVTVEGAIKSFAAFFMAWLAQSIEAAPLALRQAYEIVSVKDEVSAEMEMASFNIEQSELVNVAKEGCTFLMVASLSVFWGLDIVNSSLQAAAKCATAMDIQISLAGAQAYAAVAGQWLALSTSLRSFEFVEQTMGVVRRTWRQLHPSLQTATPQSVQVFLLLQRQFPEQVKAVIADGMLSPDPARRLRNLERFACMWNHSIEHHLMPRPANDGLFLMLDALVDDEWGPKMLARSWLADALGANAGAVLDAPLSLLLTPEARSVGPNHYFAGVYDAPRALYGFQVLSSILESCSNTSLGVQMSSLESGAPGIAPPGKHNRTGIWALASTPPSVQINGSLRSTIGPPTPKGGDAVTQSEATDELEGIVELWPVLPIPNYILTIAVACLSYLRGKVSDKFITEEDDASKKNASQSSAALKTLLETENVESDFYSTGRTDNVVWMLAGLGFRPFKALHASVSGAAAECLARLLAVLPTPTRASATVAHHLADPILSLLTSQTERLNPVLQLHFIDVVESLILCDGPAYKIASFSLENSNISNALQPTLTPTSGKANGARRDSRSQRRLSLSSIEGQNRFLPWLLEEVDRVCTPAKHGDAIGSQEVLGLRQRWIRFIGTVVTHVGITLPAATEGLLVLLVDLLASSNTKSRDKKSGFRDIDFSRLDDRVILLKTFAVICTNVLWSFEMALSVNDFSFESEAPNGQETGNQASVHFGSGSSTPTRHSVLSPRASDSSEGGRPPFRGILETASTGQGDNAEPGALGTAAMGAAEVINAMNPLRMLDFVKDVFTGAATFGAHRNMDPRRSAARILFWFLGNIIRGVAEVWGPNADVHGSVSSRNDRDNSINRGTSLLSPVKGNAPRLSKDLPRERRHAQRIAVLSVVEPMFQLRPIDVIAGVVALFKPKYDEGGAIYEFESGNSLSVHAVRVIHAIETSSPEIIISSISVILDQALKWDAKGLAAADGRENGQVRESARAAVMGLVEPENRDQPIDLSAVGQVTSSALAGGLDSVIAENASGMYSVNTIHRKEMFCAGDYFTEHSPSDIEVACFRFLAAYFDTSIAISEVQEVWPFYHELIRDIVGNSTRKATAIASLVSLASFASKNEHPMPDRRRRKEVQQVAGSTMVACSVVASGSMDLSNEPNVSDPKEAKSRLQVYAMKGMALAIPSLVSACFLDEKQLLTSLVTSALSPSVSTLKRTSARAAAIKIAARDKPQKSTTETTSDQAEDDRRDLTAASAAADLMLQVCRHDWGVKQARRELVILLDDPNFFSGKTTGLLFEMTKIVREVIAGGGASTLLTSIGTHAVTVSGGIPVFFSGRDTEAILRARAMRRIAFCVFVGEPDHYAPQVPYVLERLRDAMRMGDLNLVIECLLCLRVLLLKNGPSSIAAFRATTLSEIFKITATPSENVKAAIAALQFLDVVSLLSPADYAFERCFFFAEDENNVSDSTASTNYQPLVSVLAQNSKKHGTEKDGILRLQAGLTVYDGRQIPNPDMKFVNNYAKVLAKRNASPNLATGEPQVNVITQELGQEFVE